MNTKRITNYEPKDFAELLGVSVKILQRWDRDNILKAKRIPTDRRHYTCEQYLEFKGINNVDTNRKTVIYTRVSANGQKRWFEKWWLPTMIYMDMMKEKFLKKSKEKN